MTTFYILAALVFFVLVLFLNRWSGWKNDARNQILLYKQLKTQLPEAHESNLASRLLRLKIKSNGSESLRNYFEPLATQSGITLNTALFFTIEYDYIRVRGLNPSESGPTLFLRRVKDFIDKTVKEEFPKGA